MSLGQARPYLRRGANDNIIPLSDNLFEIVKEFPKNPLTEQLRAFRQYRPVRILGFNCADLPGRST